MSSTTSWQQRVDATDWSRISDELDTTGCALTGPLLTPADADDIVALYPDVSRFRSTIDTGPLPIRRRSSTATSGSPARRP